MTETDIFYDMPCEPHVHTPKASLISRGNNQPKTDNYSFQEISVIQKLCKAKFPVFLVNYKNKRYAMKVFPVAEQDNKAEVCFQNETRFASLSHPHIIKTLHSEQNKEFPCKEGMRNASYTLMEYAANGDCCTFLSNNNHLFKDEKLVRTYFRQLIEGLEYLHNRGVAHLDIKMENLLLDANFSLKIADFDLSAFTGEKNPLAQGTKFYRAPEILFSDYVASSTADIYSAGVILFVMKSSGILPHSEEIYCEGINLFELLTNDEAKFWNTHCKIQHRDASFFDDDFKSLFMSMMKNNPSERATIQEIKRSKWYNGSVYTEEELGKVLQNLRRAY